MLIRSITLRDSTEQQAIEHLAGVEDSEFAIAAYRAACKRWPGAAITLRRGTQVIADNRRERAP
jgi:hypothetical protein